MSTRSQKAPAARATAVGGRKARRSTPVPLVGVGLVVLGLLIGLKVVQVFRLRSTLGTSIEEVFSRQLPVGQAIAIPHALIAFSPAVSGASFDARDERRQKHHRFVLIQDAKSGRQMLMLHWRTTFLNASDVGNKLRADVRGTLMRTPIGIATDLKTAFPELSAEAFDIYLDEMFFAPVTVGHVLGALVSVMMVAMGALQVVKSVRPRSPAPTSATAASGAASRPRSARPTAGEDTAVDDDGKRSSARRTCVGCGADTPVASRQCITCRAPVEVEYYVVAAVPFEGFERFVPVITRVLGVSEYQAREPLARVHTPLPYHHLDSFYLKGPGEGTPYRLVSRGINSLVSAQALSSDLNDAGAKAFIVGSDELTSGEAARPASELRYADDEVTFIFDAGGGEKDERRIRWSRIALVVFSADVPLRGTMTIARDVRESAPGKDSAAYLVDVYELDNPNGIRIAEETFYRWEFLKLSGSERPADRFGKLIELLETHATDADIQFVTGAYRGPSQPWRINYFSRLSFLAGAKSGWAREEGAPKLDGYELLEKVGQGAMGAVYRAKQRRLGRMAAVKVVAQSLAAQDKFIDRFKAEARAVAALAHPNIVQVIDLVEQRGRYFMIMEFVEGVTLGSRIKREKRLSEVESLSIGLEVARALVHAAGRGIIHRDVKPENIFLTMDGGVKLGDWGLAKELEQDLGLTDTGTALGTPFYMSPEQASARRDLDVRSDFYSLGATVFHALAGTPPFRGGSPTEVLIKHLKTPAPDVRTIVPEVSEESAQLLARLLSKEPGHRCTEASEVVTVFESALASARSRVTG